MKGARRFELREVDDYTGAVVASGVILLRWDLDHPPAFLKAGPCDVGGGLTAEVELRPPRTGRVGEVQ